MEPLVSIIIPVYNDKLITDAIESSLNQTYTNIEIIVIDDGSDKNIEQIILPYKDNIIYRKTEKRGVSHARNLGISISKGEYIAFLDSDDKFIPDKIEKQIVFCKKNNASFSYTGYKKVDKDTGNIISIVNENLAIKFPEIISGCPIAMPTVMIKKDIIQDNILFNETLHIGEDICAWIDLSYKYKFFLLNEPLTLIRINKKSAAYNEEKQKKGISNIINYLINNDIYNKYEEECYKLILILINLYKKSHECPSDKKIFKFKNLIKKTIKYYKIHGLYLTIKKIKNKFIH